MEDRAIQDAEAVDIKLNKANVEYIKLKIIHVKTQEIFQLEPLDLSLAGSIAKKKLLKTEDQRCQSKIKLQKPLKLPPLADPNHKIDDEINNDPSKKKPSCSILPVMKAESESSKKYAKEYNGDFSDVSLAAGPSGLCNNELRQGEMDSQKISSSLENKSLHDEKSNRFKCEECSYSSLRKRDLERHIQVVHKKLNKPFKCNYCNYSDKCKSYLAVHLLSVHKMAVFNKMEKQHKCEICDFSCSTKRFLYRHICAVHETQKPFKCNECSMTFEYNSYLTKHIKAIHQKVKNFKCGECNHTFCFR